MFDVDKSLTVPQAAMNLGLSEETIRRHIRSRRLDASRIGNQYFIAFDALAAFEIVYDRKTGRLKGD